MAADLINPLCEFEFGRISAAGFKDESSGHERSMESGNALVIMIKRRSSPVVTSAFLFYRYSREYAEFNTLVSSVRYDIIFR